MNTDKPLPRKQQHTFQMCESFLCTITITWLHCFVFAFVLVNAFLYCGWIITGISQNESHTGDLMGRFSLIYMYMYMYIIYLCYIYLCRQPKSLNGLEPWIRSNLPLWHTDSWHGSLSVADDTTTVLKGCFLEAACSFAGGLVAASVALSNTWCFLQRSTAYSNSKIQYGNLYKYMYCSHLIYMDSFVVDIRAGIQ